MTAEKESDTNEMAKAYREYYGSFFMAICIGSAMIWSLISAYVHHAPDLLLITALLLHPALSSIEKFYHIISRE